MRYVAASYPDTKKRETGIGACLLLHTHALETASAYDELDDYVDIIDLVRTLTWEYGFGSWSAT